MKGGCFQAALRLSVAMMVSALISACATAPTALDYPQQLPDLKKKSFHVTIPSFDGTELKATVFQPDLKAGETAPMVVHTHGFGVFRMSQRFSIYGKLIITGQAAIEAWDRGYWVISYDQRGHGASDGMIRVMDPNYEVKDLSRVIDWVEQNIPALSYDGNDPMIGIVSESYGAGASLMGALMDPRIDAVAPFTTWHDLETSLSPNNVPKSGWLTTLITVGNVLNPGHMDPVLNQAYFDARKGEITPETYDYLEDHAPKYFCDQGRTFNADILFFQGFRDVLFNVNQGMRNYQCARQSKNDIRFIGIQGGHQLPFTQWTWVPGFQVEKRFHCGDQTFETKQVVVDWFDEKLKRIDGAAAAIPSLCLTHDKDSGSLFSDIPFGGDWYQVREAVLETGSAGYFELPMALIDHPRSWLKLDDGEIDDKDLAIRGGGVRPAFIPVTAAQSTGFVTGIPVAELTVENLNPEVEPILFVGIGVRRAGTARTQLLNQQVTPIKGEGVHQLEMAAVSGRLAKGDVVGLMVYAYHNQFRFSGSGRGTEARIAGQVALPLGLEAADSRLALEKPPVVSQSLE